MSNANLQFRVVSQEGFWPALRRKLFISPAPKLILGLGALCALFVVATLPSLMRSQVEIVRQAPAPCVMAFLVDKPPHKKSSLLVNHYGDLPFYGVRKRFTFFPRYHRRTRQPTGALDQADVAAPESNVTSPKLQEAASDFIGFRPSNFTVPSAIESDASLVEDEAIAAQYGRILSSARKYDVLQGNGSTTTPHIDQGSCKDACSSARRQRGPWSTAPSSGATAPIKLTVDNKT